MTWSDLEKTGLPRNTIAVVNLAGQNILDKKRKWTAGFKQTVRASRINTNLALVDAIVRAEKKPNVFVSTSGVGYYPASTTKEYNEDSEEGIGDYFAELCKDWEAAAQVPVDCGVRSVIIRTGVVLGRRGGMISEIYLPFYMGLGGPMGSGQQYLPWIHIKDIARLFKFSIEKDGVTGVLNGVAPQTITNKEFAQALGKSMWRPALIPLPAFVFDKMLGPERASMITQGQKVVPQRTLAQGFEFTYPDIDSACAEFAPFIYTDDYSS